MFFITGTADKESLEGCHGQTFCIVYNAIFNYQFDLFYCARRAGATGRKCTMTINARHASGCGLVAIFGIIVWESARVFVNRWSGGYLSRSHLCLDMLDVSLYRNEYTPGNVMAEL